MPPGGVPPFNPAAQPPFNLWQFMPPGAPGMPPGMPPGMTLPPGGPMMVPGMPQPGGENGDAPGVSFSIPPDMLANFNFNFMPGMPMGMNMPMGMPMSMPPGAMGLPMGGLGGPGRGSGPGAGRGSKDKKNAALAGMDPSMMVMGTGQFGVGGAPSRGSRRESATFNGQYNEGKWNEDEKKAFKKAYYALDAEHDWVAIADRIGTRHSGQVRSHFQKFQKQLEEQLEAWKAFKSEWIRKKAAAAAGVPYTAGMDPSMPQDPSIPPIPFTRQDAEDCAEAFIISRLGVGSKDLYGDASGDAGAIIDADGNVIAKAPKVRKPRNSDGSRKAGAKRKQRDMMGGMPYGGEGEDADLMGAYPDTFLGDLDEGVVGGDAGAGMAGAGMPGMMRKPAAGRKPSAKKRKLDAKAGEWMGDMPAGMDAGMPPMGEVGAEGEGEAYPAEYGREEDEVDDESRPALTLAKAGGASAAGAAAAPAGRKVSRTGRPTGKKGAAPALEAAAPPAGAGPDVALDALYSLSQAGVAQHQQQQQ